MAVLYFGRLVENARAEGIFSRPRHPYTKLLARSAPVVGHALARTEAVAAELPDPLNPPPGCAFAARCPHAEADCRSEAPPLTEIDSDHDAACFHPLA